MNRPRPGIYVPCRKPRILDGDTVEVESYTGARWAVRLEDCWCHETSDPRGVAAKQYVQEVLDDARELMMFVALPEDIEDKSVNLLNLFSFNRVVGDIIVSPTGRTLAELVRGAKHGYRTKEELQATQGDSVSR